MSDDTRSDPLVATGHAEESADDPTLDTFATITIKVEQDGDWYEIEFQTKARDFEVTMESTTAALIEEEFFPMSPEAMVRAWPKNRKHRLHLEAKPVPHGENQILYIKRTSKAG